MTTAKSATASYVPIGITGVSKEIGDFFEDNFFAHGHTFEAHPFILTASEREYYEILNILGGTNFDLNSIYINSRLPKDHLHKILLN